MNILKISALLLGMCGLAQGTALSLTPSLPTPALVGQMITWQANVVGPGDFRFRFRVRAIEAVSDKSRRRRSSSDFHMVRDYSRTALLDWTAADHEGYYEIEAAAKNLTTGDVALTSLVYQFSPRVSGTTIAVSPTIHPLVFLFSAPPCVPGARMHVEFRSGLDLPRSTPSEDCVAGQSMNFYLAGLFADTDYQAQSVTESGSQTTWSGFVSFHTGLLPQLPFTQAPIIPAPPGATQPILLAAAAGGQIATDLSGRVVWYNPAPFIWATRPVSGGYLWGVMEFGDQDITHQAIREVDLTGMTVLETNAERVNEQLTALGKRRISGFHHEVRPISGDRIVALAGVEQLLTDVQGPGTKDVIGDMIVVFDRNLNVVWTWDTFDFLDVTRMSTTKDVCTPASSACSPFYLASTANDWTHGNSVQETPDGQLLFSSRHQDWLIKIDYSGGTGSGNVLWRLGRDGDFTPLSTNPSPWFSHQHDANFEASNPSQLLVFDNGNTRPNPDGSHSSRGQVMQLDANKRTATSLLIADLGVYSAAVGSAQRLENGNYHFNAGFVSGPAGLGAIAFEVNPAGQVVFKMQTNNGLYRSFRMSDMYAAADSL